MVLALPPPTAMGLLEYGAFAVGLSIGFALLRPVGAQVEQAISKR